MTYELELRYPQDAPERLEALLSYLNDWHEYEHNAENHAVQLTVSKEVLDSELHILQKHFPWLDVQQFVSLN
ncbi:hypothetical protein [Shewanella dokdonensis]|uniref:Uncharacterized protein n=1 Tax=Shewanella dokdonensis TaxID=712036 RepID=A0ABX8DEJ4_9GAMM|nr:hypothetical protein [Shewanella dokdonensis]MCL1072969.1 hypothetical protein [Shewanella dokdonensis]QVK23111.1 hypothetical protein KHX94_18805 [Shewanella dokdonensis]